MECVYCEGDIKPGDIVRRHHRGALAHDVCIDARHDELLYVSRHPDNTPAVQRSYRAKAARLRLLFGPIESAA